MPSFPSLLGRWWSSQSIRLVQGFHTTRLNRELGVIVPLTGPNARRTVGARPVGLRTAASGSIAGASPDRDADHQQGDRTAIVRYTIKFGPAVSQNELEKGFDAPEMR